MVVREADERDRRVLSDLLQEAVTRRDFGRFMAIAVGLTGLTPTLVANAAGGSLPAARLAAKQDGGSGGTLTFARSGDSDSLDPHHTIAGISWQVFTNIYDTLIAKNMDLEYEGILAESWEISEDGLEYTFHLRQGIAFHDGSEFNADSVKFTFDRVTNPETNAPAAPWVSALKETVVVDPATVKLVLNEPFAPLLGNISIAYFGMLPPQAVQDAGDEFGKKPIGTGPWKFQEWIEGESITLVPNENYQNFHSYVENKGAPLLDELVFRNIPEANTQVAALETDEVNLIAPPPREVKRFQEDDAYQVFTTSGGTNIYFLEFSMIAPPEGQYGVQFKPPFDDPAVRQAVAYGTNADEIITSVLEGLAIRNYGPMPTDTFAYKPEIEEFGYHYDPEKAKSVLEEAGWTDSDGDGVREKAGKKLEVLLWTWNDSTNERVVQVIQNQLDQVGFKVNLETMEVATLLARLKENVSDLDLMGWGWPEPDILSMMTDTEGGIGLYHDEEYQKLVVQARTTSDLAERTALYFDAAKKMLADAAMVPLWTYLEATAIRSSVKNFKLGPQALRVYEDAYVED